MKDDVTRVKDVVESVLKNDVRTRNNDKWLTFAVLKKMGFKVFVPYSQVDNLPAFESISRCRRKFQEDGLYPAKEEVSGFRSDEEGKMRDIRNWWD